MASKYEVNGWTSGDDTTVVLSANYYVEEILLSYSSIGVETAA